MLWMSSSFISHNPSKYHKLSSMAFFETKGGSPCTITLRLCISVATDCSERPVIAWAAARVLCGTATGVGAESEVPVGQG